ncbi:Uncharacterised protein [uncultured archaeon]|nr:Uncharacterised protein [uncultured archaeon]
MKKRALIISLMTILFLVNIISAKIIINEVEINPYNGNEEWIELYSDQVLNLEGWKIVEKNNRTLTINADIQNYLIIDLENGFLDNQNEVIMLYNKTSLVYTTPILNDISADTKTWNYCNSTWSFLDSTPGTPNNCQIQTIPKNETVNPLIKPSLQMNWNSEDIINGKNFDITIGAFNLDNKNYDVRAYIYLDDPNKVISDSYNDYDWVSSNAYVNNFFEGPGNKTGTISIRIKEVYKNLSGNARIGIKIREAYSSGSIAEINGGITILKPEGGNLNNPIENPVSATQNSFNGQVIKISSNNTNTPKSNNWFVYPIVGFITLIVIFVIILSVKFLS